MRKGKLIFILVLTVGLGVFALCMLSRSHGRSTVRQRLPDGSYLRLGKVGFGNVHSYYAQARAASGWRARVGRALPTRLAAMLDMKPYEGGALTIFGGRGTNFDVRGTNLDVFTVFEGGLNSRYSTLRLVLSDDADNSYDAGTTLSVSSSSEGSYQFQMNGWIAPAFSGQSKQLHLRFYDFLKKDSPCVAEFTVRNPAAVNTLAH